MASVDEFSIVIKGVGGHAAIPDRTVDPILVAAHIVTGLQHLVSRVVSPIGSVVVTVGSFHAGTANNIIPQQAFLEGTVRCLEPEYRDVAEEHLRSFVTQAAEAFRASADITYKRVLPAVVNDAALCDLVKEVACKIVGRDRVVTTPPTMAGEDFSLYQEALPGCFFFVGTGNPDGSSRAWHHPQFDVDESMLVSAARVFVGTAVEWLKTHEVNAHKGD
jgi:amidohydrolase